MQHLFFVSSIVVWDIIENLIFGVRIILLVELWWARDVLVVFVVFKAVLSCWCVLFTLEMNSKLESTALLLSVGSTQYAAYAVIIASSTNFCFVCSKWTFITKLTVHVSVEGVMQAITVISWQFYIFIVCLPSVYQWLTFVCKVKKNFVYCKLLLWDIKLFHSDWCTWLERNHDCDTSVSAEKYNHIWLDETLCLYSYICYIIFITVSWGISENYCVFWYLTVIM